VLLFIYYNGDVMQIKISEIENKSNIIDIRTSTEFNEFNIGGRNITRMNLLKNPEYYLDKNNTYYIVCNKGMVSLSCSRLLNALGYNCYSVAGGIDDLKKL
jgi:rhodanese-related sulfurtransferase